MKNKKFGFKLRKGAQVPPQHFIQIAFADRMKNSPSNPDEDEENNDVNTVQRENAGSDYKSSQNRSS